MNPAIWISNNAIWIALAVISVYLIIQGILAYIKYEDKIREFFKRFKKNEKGNEIHIQEVLQKV